MPHRDQNGAIEKLGAVYGVLWGDGDILGQHRDFRRSLELNNSKAVPFNRSLHSSNFLRSRLSPLFKLKAVAQN